MRVTMLLIPLTAAVALLAGCTVGGPSVPASGTPTANGVEALPAEEILAAGIGAVRGAESFRFSGTLGEGSAAATLNLAYAGDDLLGTGTLVGIVAQVIRIGDDLYLNADASFYEEYVPAEQQPLLDQLSGAWVKVPASLAAPLIPVPLTVDAVFEDVPAGTLSKGEVATLGGTPVIRVTDSEGAVYSVATVGEPYLLEIAFDGQFLEFSNFNEPVTVEPPAGATDLLAWLLGQG